MKAGNIIDQPGEGAEIEIGTLTRRKGRRAARNKTFSLISNSLP